MRLLQERKTVEFRRHPAFRSTALRHTAKVQA